MTKYQRLLFFTALLFTINCLYGQEVRVEKAGEWFQRGYYILNPTLARTKTEVAFVRRLSGLDSTIGPGSFLQGVFKHFLTESTVTGRFFDPVVGLYDFRKKQLHVLDYGWAPAFSPNDLTVAYAYQYSPLQKQDRLYAASFKGNSIKTFYQPTLQTSEVAKPSGNYYLTDPFFADSTKLVYKTGDKVNGPYGGAISISELDLKSKKTTLVRQPAIRHRLYELVGETYFLNKKLAYTLYSPADSGTGLASEYLHLLVSGRDTLQNFGIRRFTNLAYKFAFNANNNLVFLDDAHYMAEDTNFMITYNGEKLIDRKPIPFSYEKAFLSPDARYLLYFTQNREAYLADTKSFSTTKIDKPTTEMHAVVWSADGNRFALVQDHESYKGTDKLLVYEVKR